jgi:hypothetical protein
MFLGRISIFSFKQKQLARRDSCRRNPRSDCKDTEIAQAGSCRSGIW